jgi:hypothetical protein
MNLVAPLAHEATAMRTTDTAGDARLVAQSARRAIGGQT